MKREARTTGFVFRLYRSLVRFFPHRFRCAFEHEMLETTAEAAVWIRRQSLVPRQNSIRPGNQLRAAMS